MRLERFARQVLWHWWFIKITRNAQSIHVHSLFAQSTADHVLLCKFDSQCKRFISLSWQIVYEKCVFLNKPYQPATKRYILNNLSLVIKQQDCDQDTIAAIYQSSAKYLAKVASLQSTDCPLRISSIWHWSSYQADYRILVSQAHEYKQHKVKQSLLYPAVLK